MKSPKEIRLAARRSRAWVAAHAGVSEPACRVFEEAGPGAVTPRVRDALSSFYERLAKASATAPSGPEAA